MEKREDFKEEYNEQKNRIHLFWGCDKNRVDSEVMLGILQKNGYTAVADEAEADIIVVNTCCFIKDALEESIETILEMSQYKNPDVGNCKGLIVAGCLGQRYEKEFFDELPEVDAIIGTTAYESIAEVADEILGGKEQVKQLESIDLAMQDGNGKLRVLSTAPYFAYLKISEGCDNRCTYCVIPQMRGRHRSRELESLVEEATLLAQQGVKELVIVAQDTSIYGRDLYGKPMLDELLRRLNAIEGLEWIRLLYAYPETLTEETIEAMASCEKVCHYIDMPIQHGNDAVLKRMGRKSSQALIRGKGGKAESGYARYCHSYDTDCRLPRRTEGRICGFAELRAGNEIRPSGCVLLFAGGRHGCGGNGKSDSGGNEGRTQGISSWIYRNPLRLRFVKKRGRQGDGGAD